MSAGLAVSLVGCSLGCLVVVVMLTMVIITVIRERG
jgi:hypothetical protein